MGETKEAEAVAVETEEEEAVRKWKRTMWKRRTCNLYYYSENIYVYNY